MNLGHFRPLLPDFAAMWVKDAYRKCDVYIYARQYDDRHPELAGPWSEVMIVTVP